MTFLKKGDNFEITSEKIEHCMPDWFWLPFLIGSIMFVAGLPLMYYFAITTEISIGLAFVIFAVWVLLSLSVVIIPVTYYSGCGVQVRLSIFGDQVDSESFKFSGDTVKDAARLQTIIYWFEDQAKQETKKKTACCDIYKEVIGKVKL
jgi:hypothetical protein